MVEAPVSWALQQEVDVEMSDGGFRVSGYVMFCFGFLRVEVMSGAVCLVQLAPSEHRRL